MNMLNLVVSWYVFIGLVLTNMAVFSYRMFRDRHHVSLSTVLKLLISNILLLIMGISVLPAPVPLWLYLIRVFCVQFGTLLVYVAVEQSLGVKRYQPLRSRQVVVICALFLLGLGLVYYREQGLISAQGRSIEWVWAYYISYLINYGLYLYLFALIIQLYWRNLRPYHDLPYLVRLFVCMCGFIASALGIVVQAINSLVAPSVTTLDRQMLDRIFGILFITSVILITCGFSIPQAVIKRLVQPFQRMRVWQEQRRYAAIHYLHHVMTSIVPGVQLHNQRLHDVRMLVEISDARQIIWSRQPHTPPLTPEVEAAHLADLFAQNTIIDWPGEYRPPRTKQSDIIKHNLAVARLLKQQLGKAPVAPQSFSVQ